MYYKIYDSNIKSWMAALKTLVHILFSHAFFNHEGSHITAHITEINFTIGCLLFFMFCRELNCTDELGWVFGVFTIIALFIGRVLFDIHRGAFSHTLLHYVGFFTWDLFFATHFTEIALTIHHGGLQSSSSQFTPFYLRTFGRINTHFIIKVLLLTRVV